MHRKHTSIAGFTLLELGMVLTVIALLVGGILTGQSLVRSAELRSIAADANAYISAANNFRSQYRFLPGDMTNAATYWSTTVDGNGDGQVGGDERFRFWQQLNLAGFLDRSYTGVTGSGGANDFVIGSNIPASRLREVGYSFYYANMTTNGTTTFTVNLGNMLAIGRTSGADAGPPLNAMLSSLNAYSLDRKFDDSMPATGRWIASSIGAGNFAATNSCTDAANGTTYTANYRANETIDCALYVMSGF